MNRSQRLLVGLLATLAMVVGLSTVTASSAGALSPIADQRVNNVAKSFHLVKTRTIQARTAHHAAIVHKVWKDSAGHRIWYKGDPAGSLDSVVLDTAPDGSGSAEVAIVSSGGNCCDGSWQVLNSTGPSGAISFGFDVESNDIHARAGSSEIIATRYGNGAIQDVLTQVSASGWSNDGLHGDNCNVGPLRCARIQTFWTRTIYNGSGGSTVGWDPQATSHPSACSTQSFSVSAQGVGISASSPVCPDSFGPNVIQPQVFGTIYQGAMKEGNVVGAGQAEHRRGLPRARSHLGLGGEQRDQRRGQPHGDREGHGHQRGRQPDRTGQDPQLPTGQLRPRVHPRWRHRDWRGCRVRRRAGAGGGQSLSR
jgi:hypothetical protein